MQQQVNLNPVAVARGDRVAAVASGGTSSSTSGTLLGGSGPASASNLGSTATPTTSTDLGSGSPPLVQAVGAPWSPAPVTGVTPGSRIGHTSLGAKIRGAGHFAGLTVKSRSRSTASEFGSPRSASGSPRSPSLSDRDASEGGPGGGPAKRSYYKDRLVQNPLISAVASFRGFANGARDGLDFVEEGPASPLGTPSLPGGGGLGGGMPALPLTPRRRLPRGRYAAALFASKSAGMDDSTQQAGAKLWRSKPTDIEYR